MIHQHSPWFTSIHHDSPAFTLIHQHSPAFTSIHQHSPAFTSIHQHSPAFTSIHQHSPAFTSIHQHSPAFTSIHQHSPAFTSIHLDSWKRHKYIKSCYRTAITKDIVWCIIWYTIITITVELSSPQYKYENEVFCIHCFLNVYSSICFVCFFSLNISLWNMNGFFPPSPLPSPLTTMTSVQILTRTRLL